jgi:hypothetical protein
MAADLNSKSSRVKTYGLAADILGLATLVAGGISLKWTLSMSPTRETHIAVTPSSIQLAGHF